MSQARGSIPSRTPPSRGSCRRRLEHVAPDVATHVAPGEAAALLELDDLVAHPVRHADLHVHRELRAEGQPLRRPRCAPRCTDPDPSMRACCAGSARRSRSWRGRGDHPLRPVHPFDLLTTATSHRRVVVRSTHAAPVGPARRAARPPVGVAELVAGPEHLRQHPLAGEQQRVGQLGAEQQPGPNSAPAGSPAGAAPGPRSRRTRRSSPGSGGQVHRPPTSLVRRWWIAPTSSSSGSSSATGGRSRTAARARA